MWGVPQHIELGMIVMPPCCDAMTAQKRTRRGSFEEKGRAPTAHRDEARYRHTANAGRRAIVDQLPFPTDTEIAVLHQRLLAGHAYAADAAIERLLPVLVHLVRRAFPRTDEELIVNAVEDALIEYSTRPEQFDRSRGVPLVAFLRLAAVRNTANLVRGESRRVARERALLEDRHALRAEASPVVDQWHDPVHSSALQSALADAVRPEEQLAVTLWLKGERRTNVIAVALGVDRLGLAEQRRTVKQLKDRIRRRLERLLRPARRG